MTEQKVIRFKDLSWPIKTIVVVGWISIGYYGAMFLLGVVLTMLGY